MLLTEVYHIPHLLSNIINIGQMGEIGVKTVVDKGIMSLLNRHNVVLARVGRMPTQLYAIHLNLTEPVSLLAQGGDPAWRWHTCYGHFHFCGLHDLAAKSTVIGMPTIDHVD